MENELLKKCKDEVAKKYGYTQFNDIVWYFEHGLTPKGKLTMMSYIDEYTALYSSKLRENDRKRIEELEYDLQKKSDAAMLASQSATRRGKIMKELQERVERMEKALRIVSEWKFPETGKFWDDAKTERMSYTAAFGSHGERDYMRAIADSALSGEATKENKETD